MVYLRLFNGRYEPSRYTEDYDGPVIGPCKYVHFWALGIIHIGHPDGEHGNFDLRVEDGLVFFDRMFYNDLSIDSLELDAEEAAITEDEFLSVDEACSRVNIKRVSLL